MKIYVTKEDINTDEGININNISLVDVDEPVTLELEPGDHYLHRELMFNKISVEIKSSGTARILYGYKQKVTLTTRLDNIYTGDLKSPIINKVGKYDERYKSDNFFYYGNIIVGAESPNETIKTINRANIPIVHYANGQFNFRLHNATANSFAHIIHDNYSITHERLNAQTLRKTCVPQFINIYNTASYNENEYYYDFKTNKISLRGNYEAETSIVALVSEGSLVFNGCNEVKISNIDFVGGVNPFLQFLDSSNITVSECTFKMSAAKYALRIKNSNETTIKDCEFLDCSNGVAKINGGNPLELIAGNIVIKNCLIERCGHIYNLFPILNLKGGVAQSILNCDIRKCFSLNIVEILGNDHKFEHNKCQENSCNNVVYFSKHQFFERGHSVMGNLFSFTSNSKCFDAIPCALNAQLVHEVKITQNLIADMLIKGSLFKECVFSDNILTKVAPFLVLIYEVLYTDEQITRSNNLFIDRYNKKTYYAHYPSISRGLPYAPSYHTNDFLISNNIFLLDPSFQLVRITKNPESYGAKVKIADNNILQQSYTKNIFMHDLYNIVDDYSVNIVNIEKLSFKTKPFIFSESGCLLYKNDKKYSFDIHANMKTLLSQDWMFTTQGGIILRAPEYKSIPAPSNPLKFKFNAEKKGCYVLYLQHFIRQCTLKFPTSLWIKIDDEPFTEAYTVGQVDSFQQNISRLHNGAYEYLSFWLTKGIHTLQIARRTNNIELTNLSLKYTKDKVNTDGNKFIDGFRDHIKLLTDSFQDVSTKMVEMQKMLEDIKFQYDNFKK